MSDNRLPWEGRSESRRFLWVGVRHFVSSGLPAPQMTIDAKRSQNVLRPFRQRRFAGNFAAPAFRFARYTRGSLPLSCLLQEETIFIHFLIPLSQRGSWPGHCGRRRRFPLADRGSRATVGKFPYKSRESPGCNRRGHIAVFLGTFSSEFRLEGSPPFAGGGSDT